MSIEPCSFARWSERSRLRFLFKWEGFLHNASLLLFSVETKKTVFSRVSFASYSSAIICFCRSAWAKAQLFSCPFNPWIFLKCLPQIKWKSKRPGPCFAGSLNLKITSFITLVFFHINVFWTVISHPLIPINVRFFSFKLFWMYWFCPASFKAADLSSEIDIILNEE